MKLKIGAGRTNLASRLAMAVHTQYRFGQIICPLVLCKASLISSPFTLEGHHFCSRIFETMEIEKLTHASSALAAPHARHMGQTCRYVFVCVCATGIAMDLFISEFVPGGRKSLLVECVGCDSTWVYAHEIPFGHQVMFCNEGYADNLMTLYDIVTTGDQMNGFWMLEIDDHSSLFGNQTPGVKDFRYAHDVCSGLGGFGTSVLAKSRSLRDVARV